MSYPHPRQPKDAWLDFGDDSNVVGKIAQHYLVDLEQPGLPYSRNHFMLIELMTTGGEIPAADVDIVIFHHQGTVLAIAQVSGIIAIQSSPARPGQYRTLVSCEPMSTVADVPVAEEDEEYVDAEVDHVLCRVDENCCPRTSYGRMPKGAPMRDQQRAHSFTLNVLVDAHCSF